MQQYQHIPIEDEDVETAEQAEEAQHLRDVFADMEKKQPDVLDETAKSIIERIATFLAVLFAVTALGNNFPPRYLVGHFWEKALVIAILACYLVAMFLALWSLQPRKYSVYLFNRSKRQKEWERLLRRKTAWTKAAGLLCASLWSVVCQQRSDALMLLFAIPVKSLRCRLLRSMSRAS